MKIFKFIKLHRKINGSYSSLQNLTLMFRLFQTKFRTCTFFTAAKDRIDLVRSKGDSLRVN